MDRIILKNINFFVLNSSLNSYLIFFFKNKQFSIIFNSNLRFNKKLNVTELVFFKKLNLKTLNLFFFSWNYFLIKRLKIRHKISLLKLFRKNNFIVKFNFGFSYNVYFLLNNIFFRKKKKYLTYSQIMFWTINSVDEFKLPKYIINFQPLNQYTLRGLRFSSQKFIKRVGKISKYNEFKIKIL